MHNLTFKFSDPTDPFDLLLYQKFEILDSNKLLFSMYDEYLEMESKKFGSNHRTFFSENNRKLYIIECNNRPEPAFFRIVEFHNNMYNLVGITEPNTADIITDIDNDGKLEICGYNTYCQVENNDDYKKPDFCIEHFRVYEISSEIVRDTITEKIEIEKKNMR